MSTLGKATLQGLGHGAFVGLTGDRTRATSMRRALEQASRKSNREASALRTSRNTTPPKSSK